MHTLTSYQSSALAASPDYTLTAVANGLATASDGAIKVVALLAQQETGPVAADEREQVTAYLGGLLFNAAMLASLLSLDFNAVAETQLRRLQGAQNSGQLRRAVLGASGKVAA